MCSFDYGRYAAPRRLSIITERRVAGLTTFATATVVRRSFDAEAEALRYGDELISMRTLR